ncbi:MAG: hypothetical protein AAB877_03560 [Patescibacteria group bacterium]
MNFLEQLAAEWYEYKGYFVRTNIKYGKNSKGRGGHSGEIDVAAYNPKTKKLIHIECSTEASTKEKLDPKFQKKFSTARENYDKVFTFSHKEIERIAIVGFHKPKSKLNFGSDVKIFLIPEFIKEITDELKNKSPMQDAIPESYPLLRAIQYSSFLSKK